ncbi:hypothetical protein VMCG_02442 [Cytospora schulzeri]|uniref:Uncharacterized protein n=1 Tax=Cytospora schulzeri TaxID=448051 RepID=A0A423X0T8_9PEZI|nr:hypothetical protein VMCG_02442 [Valsa malicola]
MMEVHLFHPEWTSTWLPQLTSNSSVVNIFSDKPAVPWITDVTYIAKTGWLQVAFLVISLLWTIDSLRASRRIKVAPSSSKATQISVGFELCSQITRAVALAFIIVAAVEGDSKHWYNVALISCAFTYGLSRLFNDPKWRHTALHQVNFLLGTSLLLLAATEVLPMLELHSTYRPGNVEIGAIASLAAANLVALCTPREWAPPATSLELLQRTAEVGPTPEETCSWFTSYLSYEWLTPLIWKGTYITSYLHSV